MMIRATEVYRLHGGASGTLFKYNQDYFFIDGSSQISLVPSLVVRCLESTQGLIRDGNIYEKTVKQFLELHIANIEHTALYSEIHQPEKRAQALLIGEDVFYLKTSFLEDFPDGVYEFSDGETGVRIITRHSALQSYSSVGPKDVEDGNRPVYYMFKYTDNGYVGMDVV